MGKLNIDTPSKNKNVARSLKQRDLDALDHVRRKHNAGLSEEDTPIETPEEYLDFVLGKALDSYDAERIREEKQSVSEAFDNADETTKQEVKEKLGL